MARAIQNGERESGVTVIRMTPRIDAGGMIAVARTPIDPDETAGELESRLAMIGAPLIADAILAVAAGTAQILPQRKSEVTKAPKLRKEDGLIDWTKPARSIHDLVRAMQPWPIASTSWQSGEVGRAPLRVIVHRTAVVEDAQGEPGRVLEANGDRLVLAAAAGAVRLLTVQVVGGKALPVATFLNGHRVFVGDRFGGGHVPGQF